MLSGVLCDEDNVDDDGGGVLLVLSTSSSDEADRMLVEEEIIPDIAANNEDYLDIRLDDEAAFLAEYKSRLASLQSWSAVMTSSKLLPLACFLSEFIFVITGLKQQWSHLTVTYGLLVNDRLSRIIFYSSFL